MEGTLAELQIARTTLSLLEKIEGNVRAKKALSAVTLSQDSGPFGYRDDRHDDVQPLQAMDVVCQTGRKCLCRIWMGEAWQHRLGQVENNKEAQMRFHSLGYPNLSAAIAGKRSVP